MIKYKIDVLQELKRRGYTTYTLHRDKVLSDKLVQKMRSNDPSITLATLNKLCNLLSLKPMDIIEYIPDEEE